MAIRVHILAKELGVKSKAILEKCQAEGLDVKNHMSVLNAGLEATIREWFSEGEHRTTEETTERVDLKKARAKPRKRVKKKAEAQAKPAAKQAEAEPAAPTADTAVVEPPPSEAAEPVVAEVEVAKETPPPAEPAEEKPPAKPKKKAKPKAKEPEPIKPVGPEHVPAPAVLQGPRVIRVEQAEPIRRPTPARRAPVAPAAPTETPPLAPAAKAGRPTKKGRQAVPDDDAVTAKARKARARIHPRRGQTGDGTEQLKEWGDRDLLERSQRLAAASDRPHVIRRAEPRRAKQLLQAAGETKIQITEPIALKNFCAATGIAFNRLFPKLIELGMPATINQPITGEQAEMLALAFEIEVEVTKQRSRYEEIVEGFANRSRENLEPRAPVVTFLGHVDHGKTSLLDRIRDQRIAQGEAGGITQHIGAYRYQVDDRHVVFLDTPGHEAFTALRARGAQMTDIVVLVVAADDGVMPQTVEAISHARAANVPIVVALNKIDLPNTDVNRALGQLAEHKLVPTEWGGETDVIKTSATTGEGMDDLIEHLNTLSELLELKADATGPAGGVVIEARQNTTRGPVADVLVQEGCLKIGDILFAGKSSCRVRAIFDDLGQSIRQAEPSTPVEILGFDTVPEAGERFYQVDDLQTAKDIAEEKRQEDQQSEWTARPKVTLENIFEHVGEGDVKQLNVIVRADTQGSVDVLKTKLEELGTNEVKVRVLHAATGGATEGDVLLAEASAAIILGFGVVADDLARSKAQELEVQIKTYTVIYHLLEDITAALEGMLEPTYEQTTRGRATVKEVFKISRVGAVAGCQVADGVIERSAKVRIIRQNVIIREGAGLESLRRFKDDVREVRQGFECGIRIAGFDDLKEDDVIEAYEVVEIARKLQDAGGSSA